MRFLAVFSWLLSSCLIAAADGNSLQAQVHQGFTPGGYIRLRLSPGGYTIVAGSSDTIRVAYRVANEEELNLFRSFEQRGPGKYRLHAHVTTGEISLPGSR